MQKQFDDLFRALLKTGEATKLIQGLLFHYGMSNELDVAEVISEVYIRAVKSLNAGKSIANLPAWMRTTVCNIIFEQIRAKERQNGLKQQLKANKPMLDCHAEEHQVEEILAILEQLDPLDRKILLLVANGNCYEQIAEQLVQDGDVQASNRLITNLRKRVSRAREKLRRHHQTEF